MTDEEAVKALSAAVAGRPSAIEALKHVRGLLAEVVARNASLREQVKTTLDLCAKYEATIDMLTAGKETT